MTLKPPTVVSKMSCRETQAARVSYTPGYCGQLPSKLLGVKRILLKYLASAIRLNWPDSPGALQSPLFGTPKSLTKGSFAVGKQCAVRNV